jgi:D-sedoheptulose 7-phosphate isomerase
MLVAPNNSVRPSGNDQPVTVTQYFQQLERLIAQLPYEQIDGIISVLLKAFDEERTVFVFGNGGSAASASHMVSDMSRVAANRDRRGSIKVMALTDNVPVLTACANDHGYESVFSEQLKNFVQPGDVAFAISCSGDSPNVLLALTTARDAGATTVALSGFDGGAMKALCHVCAVVPAENRQMIEDLHHAVLHSISSVLRARIGSGCENGFSMVAGHGA